MALTISSSLRLLAACDVRCRCLHARVTLIALWRDADHLHLSRHSCSYADGSQHLVITLWRDAGHLHLSRCSCSYADGSHYLIITLWCDADHLHLLRRSCLRADGSHHLLIFAAAGGVRRALPLPTSSRDADRPVARCGSLSSLALLVLVCGRYWRGRVTLTALLCDADHVHYSRCLRSCADGSHHCDGWGRATCAAGACALV